jgi:ABC-type transporter Mla subunit MlaD
MAMVISEIGDLNLLHWLVSAAVPVMIIILALMDRVILAKLMQSLVKPLARLAEKIDQLEGRRLEHWPAVSKEAKAHFSGQILRCFNHMEEDCKLLYQGRWMPDPRTALPRSAWLSPAQRSAVSYKPAARILSIGVLATLISLLIQAPLPVTTSGLGIVLALLPVLTAVAAALPIVAATWQSEQIIKSRLDALYLALNRHLPVFNDQTGIATLVDAYLDYDNQMQHRLQQFTEITGRLAESDMADGVRRSVEQVLTESVAPSLQQSTTALGKLAGELTERQEQGMQTLAEQFAEALSAQLAAHMHPINREIAQMGSLMADVKNYVEVAMRAMDTVRQQSGQIQQAVGQSLQQLSTAHESMGSDFATVRDQLSLLADTTGKLTGLYQGTEQGLTKSLEFFAQKLNDGTHHLTDITRQAIQMAAETRTAADGQQAAVESQLAAMQTQTENYSKQLNETIDHLLQQVHLETAAIAANTADIGKQLQSLSGVLDSSLDQFTQGSATYVQQTLDRFDGSLADIVTRLAQTATEIQDAVDALPSAISRSVNFGS